jgi:hypothetical protein
MKLNIQMKNIYERSQDKATSIKEGDHSFFIHLVKNNIKKIFRI